MSLNSVILSENKLKCLCYGKKKTLRNTCIILWVIFDTGLKFNLQISPVVSIKGFLQVRQAASQAEVNHVEARLEKKNTNS